MSTGTGSVANELRMDSYDPETSQPSADWLQADEGERIELVSSYHRRKTIDVPNAQLHAVIPSISRAAANAHGEELAGRLEPSMR